MSRCYLINVADAEFDTRLKSLKQAKIAHQIQKNEVYVFTDAQTLKTTNNRVRTREKIV